MVSLIYLPVLISLFFLIISNFPILISGTTCYSPDGSAVNDALYQPCINIQGVESMCCALNATSTPDICSPNGLCVAGWGNQAYWRDFCTDSTWKSPNCLPKTTCDEAVHTFFFSFPFPFPRKRSPHVRILRRFLKFSNSRNVQDIMSLLGNMDYILDSKR